MIEEDFEQAIRIWTTRRQRDKPRVRGVWRPPWWSSDFARLCECCSPGRAKRFLTARPVNPGCGTVLAVV